MNYFMTSTTVSCRCDPELVSTVCAGIFILKNDKSDRTDIGADVIGIQNMLKTCDIVGVIHNVNSFHPILSALQPQEKKIIGGAHLIRNKLKEDHPGSMLNPPTYAYEVDNGLSLYFRADKWSMLNDDGNILDTPHMVTFGDEPCLNVNLTRLHANKLGKYGSVSVSVAHVLLGTGGGSGRVVNLHEHIQVNASFPLLLLGINRDSANTMDDKLCSTQIVLPRFMEYSPSLTLSSSDTIYRIHVPSKYLPSTRVSVNECCVSVYY
jgi:hypothetical protein